MTRQMSTGSQIAFTKSWLDRQGIESQLIDVGGHIDPSLSYEENIKLFKQRFKLGGGRSRQPAARGLTAAECDVAIGNYEAGFNHGVTRDACLCGHPDACVDLERKGREAKEAAKPKVTKPTARTAAKPAKKADKEPWEMRRDEYVDGHIRSPAMHWESVRLALSKGHKVPAKVLKDYPDLVKKQTAVAVPPALAPAAAPKRKTAAKTTKKPKPPTKRKAKKAAAAKPEKMKLTAEEIFKLGGKVANKVVEIGGTALKPTQREIKNAAERIGITQRDARVAIEYYNWGHTYPEAPSIKRTTRRQAAAKPATKPPAKKPKKAAAKPAKNGKPKKPAPAGTVLTAAQKKRLAATGSVTVKRGGKFVTVTR